MADERSRFDRSRGIRHTPADQATVRRSNLGLVLRHLRDAGSRSRARIAQETGLNKATVSSLVAELTDRGLVTAGDVDRAGSVGRPGLIVHLDGTAVCGIGVELNVDYAAALVLDLRGEVLFEHLIALDVPALGPERTLDAVAELVRRGGRGGRRPAARRRWGSPWRCPAWSAASTVSRPTPPTSAGTTSPSWTACGPAPASSCPIRVENDANLSAIAEWVMGPEARTLRPGLPDR